MISKVPGPGPKSHTTLVTVKRYRKYQFEIIAVSRNLETNMLLLTVGHLGYPEVVRPQGDPASIHTGLWEGEEDEISDPGYIEYQDGLIFHKEEGQDLAEVETQVQRIGSVMRCLICHRCHPITCVISFTGNQEGETYYYVVYICRIPVERALAQEEIDNDEADFDVSRFFASRTLAPDSIGASEHSDDEYDDLPDLVEVSDDEDEVPGPRRPTPQNTRSNREYEWIRMYTSTGPLEMRTMEQRLLDSVILEVEGYRALQECIGCFDCTPRIVHIMQMWGNIPAFDRLGLLCRNPSVPEAMKTFLCLHQRPNWVHAATGVLEPDFANIAAPTEPITSSIGAQAVEEHLRQHTCQFWVDGEA